MSMIDFPLADLFDGSLSLIWLERFLRSWMRVDTRLISGADLLWSGRHTQTSSHDYVHGEQSGHL